MSLIWTGEVNDPYAIGGRVGFFDSTLRDGEGAVGVVLDPSEKLEIARLLDWLGVERIDAGHPGGSTEDVKAVEAVAQAGLHAEIWGFAPLVPDAFRAFVDLGISGALIDAPVSDRKLDVIGIDRQTLLDRVTETVRSAAEHGVRAALFAVDASRADPGFFMRVCRAAIDAGGDELVVVDTLGTASPEAVADLVGRTVKTAGPDVPVHFHGHNDFGLATAAAIAAVGAGARWVQGTVNGMGERAGNANIAEVAVALRALYGVESNLRLDRLRVVSERVRELSRYELEPWKPVTAEALFLRESGPVASQFHDPPCVEPYAPELLAAERGILLGKKSGVDSIRIKAEELGLDVSAEQLRAVLDAVRALGTRKRGLVTEDEFRRIVAEQPG